jgi:hypothetical protein
MLRRYRRGALIIAVILMPEMAVAQSPLRVSVGMRGVTSQPFGLTATNGQTNDSGDFLLEAFAGSLGSLIGIGSVGLLVDCGIDDLGCVIMKVGAGGALGAVGATIGATIAARHNGSRRSVAGAALGAVVGSGAGLGVHWLLNAGTDRNIGDAWTVPIFVISQGAVAALGSRVLGKKP